MALVLLLALQLVLTVAVVAFLWRRIEQLTFKVERLESALAARGAALQRRTRVAEAGGAVVPLDGDAPGPLLADAEPAESPLARAARLWRLPQHGLRIALPFDLAPETLRGILLAVLATAPALAFFFNAEASTIVACGLAIAAAMMLFALRADSAAAAWAAALTASAWALLAFFIPAGHAAPTLYSSFAAFAGLSGLAFAYARRVAPGAAMALAMCMAVLALGSHMGMVGPAGVAYGAMVAGAAIVGALSLRLDAVHIAAFGAALLGLYVLSGQDAAAIWFTPAVAWAGGLFLAIAFVRAPQLGSRGATLAATGAVGALLAVGALNAAQHGLADRFAASGAFAALAFALGAIVALAAARRDRGFAALKLTLWVLALCAFAAISAAIFLALRPPLAAPAFGLVALGLMALHARRPDAAWPTFACAAVVLGALNSWASAQIVLAETQTWPPPALIGAGLIAPALIAGGAAFFAHRALAKFTAGLLEGFAVAAAVAAANLFVRLAFSDGATLLQPIGFVETGFHIAVWLIASLLIGSRRGASAVRTGAAVLLAGAALAASALGAALWLTPYWTSRALAESEGLFSRETLGFLAPAIFFWAHWVFWRARGSNLRTRLALGAGAVLSAAFVTLEALRLRGEADWATALVGALAFALAIVINFAPGVTADRDRPRSNLEENLQRKRRRQQRV